MPRKTALLALPEPDFSNILSADIPISLKRQQILTELGLRKPKKKYETIEERKAAAKERAKKKRAEKVKALKPFGLEPKPKPRKTKAQKKERRKERGRVRRELFREFAKMNPDMAKKAGFDPSRFRL